MMLSLNDIVNKCELKVNFEKEDLSKISEEYGIGRTFKHFNYEKDWMLHTPYYEYLIAYCKIFQPKNVLELGTQIGAGTASLSLFSKKVTTADLDISQISKEILINQKIKIIKLNYSEDCLNFYFNDFDLIFIDIDHIGIYESLIHKQLLKIAYNGIVFWDDISLNNFMKEFWNNMGGCEKIETHWHGDCGFGISKYSGNPDD